MTERNLITTITSKQKSIKNYEAQIEEHRQRQAEADNGQYAAKMQELEEAKQEMDRAKEAIENHNASLPELARQLKAAQDQSRPVSARLQEHQEAEERSKTAIRDLERGQRNWIDSYHEPMKLDRLLRLMELNEGKFRSPPIGPLGRHIKLLKPEWGSILEKQSGQSMNAFIVRSKADQLLLSNLMKDAGWYVTFSKNRNQ
jgi:chromosome segregation ATPase